MKQRILVVDDEEILRKALSRFLLKEGYEVMAVASGEEALQAFQKETFHLMLADLMMPKMGGIELIQKVRDLQPSCVSIIMTGYGTIPSAVEAIKAGAYHYLTKPFELDDIAALIQNALEHHQLKDENKRLKKQLKEKYKFKNFIGQSEPMQKVFRMIEKVAESDSTILILGASGTGKELVARAIHYNSPRADKPMVVVNCGAIPEDLLESELFGHIKGAFTGAVANKMGRFAAADKGSIFLDEIGDMSPKLQVKVLRVLQERKFEPVGGSHSIESDVRIIAATNRDLEQEVREGRFREDLFYRLNVIPISLPPLKARLSDIPLLIEHFLKKFNEENGKHVTGFEEGALAQIRHYNWPGNVRELENLVERLVVLRGSGDITAHELPAHLVENQGGGHRFASLEIPDQGLSFKSMVDDFESELILKALEKTEWNKNKAAELLQLNRTTLVEKIKRKNLDKDIVT